MAVVFDNEGHGADYPPNGFYVNHTLGYGSGNDRALLVFLFLSGGTFHSVGAFNYNGSGLNNLRTVESDQYFGRIVSLRCGFFLDSQLPASPGTYQVYVNCGQAYDGVVCAVSYAGVNQITPPDSYDVDDGNPLSGPISLNHTVASASSGVLVAGNGCDGVDPLTFTPGTGQTERSDQQRANSALQVNDKPFTSPGVKNMYSTPSANYYAFGKIIAELAASGVGPGALPNAPIIGAGF